MKLGELFPDRRTRMASWLGSLGLLDRGVERVSRRVADCVRTRTGKGWALSAPGRLRVVLYGEPIPRAERKGSNGRDVVEGLVVECDKPGRFSPAQDRPGAARASARATGLP